MDIIELHTQNEVELYLKELHEENIRVIALDIECEFNLHCYGEHLCLIQIYDGRKKIIIDPFKFQNSNGYKEIFEKKDLLKIMYDAGSDALLLANEYGIQINSIMDLRPAVSLLKYQKQSLSNVLSEELNHEPVNKKKFQMYNWMKRPINSEAVEYAMNDVIYLFELKQILLQKLMTKNLLDEYILRNLQIQTNNRKKSKLKKYEKAKGYTKLDLKQKELFKQIFIIREEYAKRINRPPNFVFSNVNLLVLAKSEVIDVKFIENGINKRIDLSVKKEILDKFSSMLKL